MTPQVDPRFESARDHLQQALAILPPAGAEVIRLHIVEAARLCEKKAYRNLHELLLTQDERPKPPL